MLVFVATVFVVAAVMVGDVLYDPHLKILRYWSSHCLWL